MRRGTLLLELLVALTILVGAGLAIMAMLSRGVRDARDAAQRLHAIDLAMSALARIEAGIATPESLDGPVPVWVDEGNDGAGAAFADETPKPSGWLLEVNTSRAGHADLSAVTVRALREGPGGAAFEASQLIRFGTALPEDENPESSLLRELAP